MVSIPCATAQNESAFKKLLSETVTVLNWKAKACVRKRPCSNLSDIPLFSGQTEEGHKELTRRDRDLNPGPPQSGVAVPGPWLQRSLLGCCNELYLSLDDGVRYVTP